MATDPNKHSIKRQKEKRQSKIKAGLKKYTLPTTLALGTIFGGATINHNYINADQRAIEAIEAGDMEALDHYAGRVVTEEGYTKLYEAAIENGSMRAINVLFDVNVYGSDGSLQNIFYGDGLARDVLDEKRSEFIRLMVEQGQYELATEFRITSNTFLTLLQDLGLEAMKEVARAKALDNSRWGNDINYITDSAIDTDYITDPVFQEYLIWHLQTLDVSDGNKIHLYKVLHKLGYSDILDDIEQDLGLDQNLSLVLAYKAAEDGGLDTMISTAIAAQLHDNSELFEIAVTAFSNGNVEQAQSFVDHFELDQNEYIRHIMMSVFRSADVENSYQAIIRYVPLDEEGMRVIFNQMDGSSDFKFELAKRIGQDLEPEVREVVANEFSGTQDDFLRGYWASLDADAAELESTVPVVTAPALPSPR